MNIEDFVYNGDADGVAMTLTTAHHFAGNIMYPPKVIGKRCVWCINCADGCATTVLAHYHNTGNIGYILLALAELLGVNESGECSDLLESFKNTPCRVASNGIAGNIIAETTWLGHFMSDNWMLAKDIVQIGFEKEN